MNPDKIKGVLLGVALGDALGAPHEFKYTSNLRYTGKLEYHVKMFNRFKKEETVYPIGSITDDTYMTITLAKQLIVDNGFNEDNIILAYEKFTTQCKMLGTNTRELFKGVTTVKGFRNRHAKKFSVPQEEWTQSNGSLMRCTPLMIFADYTNLKKDIALSNPHPVNLEAGLIYTYVLKRLTENQGVPTIDELFKYTTRPEIIQVLTDVKNKTVRDVAPKAVKGWVCTALWCALYSIYHIDKITDAFKFFIDMKGDTDTNSAILGGLFGAKYGFNKLYEEQGENIDVLVVGNPILNDIDTVSNKLYDLYLLKK